MIKSINGLFLIIFLVLLASFTLLRPSKIEKKNLEEVAQLELNEFKMYELNQTDVKVFSMAHYALKYEDRYELYNFKIHDNSSINKKTISARYAVYKDDYLHLETDVTISIDNNITLISNGADYNKTANSIVINNLFKLSSNNDSIRGINLHYNLNTKRVTASNIEATYHIEEGK